MYDVRAPPGGERSIRRQPAHTVVGILESPTSASFRRVCFVSMRFRKGKGQDTMPGVLPSLFFFHSKKKGWFYDTRFLPLFNCPIVPKHFDDTEARLRCLLRQDAVPTLAGGRHLLYVCPVCQRPFYIAGRRVYPRLTEEQLTHLGSTFHADVHALHLLPRSLCPICSTIYLDGLFTIEAYRQDASLIARGITSSGKARHRHTPHSSRWSADRQVCPLCTLVSLEPDTW